MLAPAAAPAQASHSLIDRIVERNARLIVRLIQVQRLVHDTEHMRGPWRTCIEPTCRKTLACIEANTLEHGL